MRSALDLRFSRTLLADDSVSASPVAQTTQGKLRGAFAKGVYSFRGIPYGTSTDGAMRFQPPAPAQPWTGVRDALEVGPPAPQDRVWAPTPEWRDFIGDLVGPGRMGEDCLVLNIWTPSLRVPSTRPVMVWLHGGGYVIGSSGIPVYDGDNLAAKHDVVVVGINHRLNVFGHLYLGAINAEQYADSGNVGMLDIILALQWVRANIGHFGGNPDNVTIFGESGGGGKVSVLMAMPSAKGMFHKAIVESGSELDVLSREEADAMARKFLAQVHVAPDRVDDLRKIPMDQLLAALHSMGGPLFGFGPVLDGRSLQRHPFDPDAPAVTANVPMLIGTNNDETTLLRGLNDSKLFSLNEDDMRTRLKVDLQLTDDSKLNALIATYRNHRPNATPSDIYFAITTDLDFRLDAITQAELKAAQGTAPAYMYIFAWRTPVLGGKLKAMHAAELAFVFDNVDKANGWVGKSTAAVQSLADTVSATWATFAHTGNPNHTALPHWPPYDTNARSTMIFNTECMVVNDPGKEERLAMAALHQSRYVETS